MNYFSLIEPNSAKWSRLIGVNNLTDIVDIMLTMGTDQNTEVKKVDVRIPEVNYSVKILQRV